MQYKSASQLTNLTFVILWQFQPHNEDFVNRSITDWNLLPEGAIRTSHGKTDIFKTRVRKVKTSEGK
jgi:hypothetical protein